MGVVGSGPPRKKWIEIQTNVYETIVKRGQHMRQVADVY